MVFFVVRVLYIIASVAVASITASGRVAGHMGNKLDGVRPHQNSPYPPNFSIQIISDIHTLLF